ncbi:transcriptional repressor [bacterium CPR1]|nr:transcriptional repressor [bacterium CPR1]
MERNTRQRDAIRKALIEADRPLSPAEVLAAARELSPGLGIATVYRNLKGLEEESLIARIELPGEAPRYEVAGKHHHHHFHCRTCGKVFEVEGCPGDLSALSPPGFRLEGHELVLYGTCTSCP